MGYYKSCVLVLRRVALCHHVGETQQKNIGREGKSLAFCLSLPEKGVCETPQLL
jgi:hypothetical protein